MKVFLFLLNSFLLGIGLSMDAFSVSLSNGLCEPGMKRRRMCAMAGVFGIFQALMPLIGWFCIHNLARAFSQLERFIPWTAFLLLLFIGTKMITDAIRNRESSKTEMPSERTTGRIGNATLLAQGVATSIDALSTGFAIASYDFTPALACSAIIGTVTFAICIGGLSLGKIFGTRFAGEAGIAGGIILILIGIEILLTGIL